MYISDSIKETLRPYQGKAVVIDAQRVHQPNNPGDGLITKLQFLTESKTLPTLSLRIIQSHQLVIELRNLGLTPIEVNTGELAPTLIAPPAKRNCQPFGERWSDSVLTRTSIASLPAEGSCREVHLALAGSVALPERFPLHPGQSIEIPLTLTAEPGEYQFLAGYGGGVHASPAVASNLLTRFIGLPATTSRLPKK